MRTWTFVATVSMLVACAGADDRAFDKGTFSLELSSAYVTPVRYSEAKLYQFNVAGGYYIWDGHGLNVELQGLWADQPGGSDDAIIGGFGLLGRWHFLRMDRWSIFFDGGGGVTYADHEFPQFGTNFNFTGKFGLGATFELRERLHFIAGARYFHLSNANFSGGDENPQYDGVQIWGGLMWTW
jgi:hypothetical protein